MRGGGLRNLAYECAKATQPLLEAMTKLGRWINGEDHDCDSSSDEGRPCGKDSASPRER